MRLKDKVAIVTGGGQGIGQAIAMGLAEEGAAVVIGQRHAERADAVAKDIIAKGGKAVGTSLDISSQAPCDAICQLAKDKFGGLDILVNNAALYGDIDFKRWSDWTEEEWANSFNINVVGGWRMCKAAVPLMRERGKGKIVNISSATVHQGFHGLLPYTSSKAAVISNTRGISKALGRYNITVNCLAIGYVATEASLKMASYSEAGEKALIAMRAIQRRQVAEDQVGTVLYFATDESDFVTGQCVCVDGGTEFTGM
ncbi:MAG: SDR family oxidoreductase [Dehalococcoidia bacterium]|jgi:NAD(P)-dependent dehydrogenase (short-subunit alcohol dehydrogenase family)|nr:MAG: SDR family oxidoreductase [Dehalococcoidia bacterium]